MIVSVGLWMCGWMDEWIGGCSDVLYMHMFVLLANVIKTIMLED
jgi:hypothetical protein